MAIKIPREFSEKSQGEFKFLQNVSVDSDVQNMNVGICIIERHF